MYFAPFSLDNIYLVKDKYANIVLQVVHCPGNICHRPIRRFVGWFYSHKSKKKNKVIPETGREGP
jgi:hypothetical protein